MRKVDAKFFAMKLIAKQFIQDNKKEGIIQNERNILSEIDHQYVIKLEHAFETKMFVVFVMEYCSGGELFF